MRMRMTTVLCTTVNGLNVGRTCQACHQRALEEKGNEEAPAQRVLMTVDTRPCLGCVEWEQGFSAWLAAIEARTHRSEHAWIN